METTGIHRVCLRVVDGILATKTGKLLVDSSSCIASTGKAIIPAVNVPLEVRYIKYGSLVLNPALRIPEAIRRQSSNDTLHP